MTIYNQFIQSLSDVNYEAMSAATTSVGGVAFVAFVAMVILMVVGDTRTAMWADKVEEELIECEEADMFDLLAKIMNKELKQIARVEVQVVKDLGTIVGDTVVYEWATPIDFATEADDLYSMETGVAADYDWHNMLVMSVPVPKADADPYMPISDRKAMAVSVMGRSLEFFGQILVASGSGMQDWAHTATIKAAKAERVHTKQEELTELFQQEWTTTEVFADEQGWPMDEQGEWMPVEINGHRIIKSIWN